MIENERNELETTLVRSRYGRRPIADVQNGDGPKGISGYRHGPRSRSLMRTFGRVKIAVPRAGLESAAGKTTEWKSSALRAYQRRTKQADSLIASAYLAGTNTGRVRALAPLFGGAVSKDTVSRVRRKVKGDWDVGFNYVKGFSPGSADQREWFIPCPDQAYRGPFVPSTTIAAFDT